MGRMRRVRGKEDLQLSVAIQEVLPNQGTDLNLRVRSTYLNACEHYQMTGKVCTHAHTRGGQPQLVFLGSHPHCSLQQSFSLHQSLPIIAEWLLASPKHPIVSASPEPQPCVFCGFGGWNSGRLHACKASTLQDQTFSQHRPNLLVLCFENMCVGLYVARGKPLSQTGGQTWVLGTTRGSLQEWQVNTCFQVLGSSPASLLWRIYMDLGFDIGTVYSANKHLNPFWIEHHQQSVTGKYPALRSL